MARRGQRNRHKVALFDHANVIKIRNARNAVYVCCAQRQRFGGEFLNQISRSCGADMRRILDIEAIPV